MPRGWFGAVVPLVLGLRLAVEEDMMMGGLIAPREGEFYSGSRNGRLFPCRFCTHVVL